ncbi:MAG: ExbD/TolR family protein [Myxococcota bacterium]|nr:biopolymer transporter ExbD [Myxococcota bacterium]
MAPEQSGGRRPVDAEINLVPFIDLLCSLIAFLLLTAVWAQIASLELQQTSTSDSIADERETLGLRVFVMEKGFKVVGKDTEVDLPCLKEPCVERTTPGATDLRIAGRESPRAQSGMVSNYDFGRLASLIAEKRALFPNDREVYIDVADVVPYDDMIRTMDTCMAAGLTSIALGGSAQ